MAMREQIIMGYLADEEVFDIIGHDFLVYLRIAVYYFALLAWLSTIRYLLDTYVVSHVYLDWITALAAISLYLKWLITLLDVYLDALLITNNGLVLFKREGLFKRSVSNFQWVAIETVAHEQDSFRDTLFRKGDLIMYVEDEKYMFRNVNDPAENALKIVERKERLLWRGAGYEENAVSDEDKSKYEVLIEALGEVVSEYVDKKYHH